MVTAVEERVNLMKAIKNGAIDYIVKPFDDERILTSVRKIMQPPVDVPK